jgi:hypothetical protein
VGVDCSEESGACLAVLEIGRCGEFSVGFRLEGLSRQVDGGFGVLEEDCSLVLLLLALPVGI